ncbi:Rho-binding antiterminator [Serratia proteamaculans]|jgi:Rho-binding antiterminator|uniref:Rho-binding antiterminator n=1 Tax=Serratia proteamaculans TaxID=28151 RepID=UPI00217AE2D3|nr:Rho-binding antiterminator [Serratia proteamaculans]CAI0828190.1 Rho-binding antiterminator [Serratia proteamaculans]CAI1581851.1 Rho-binding antiterminator [Serratia proteamaculans]CAI1615853.1 Rho-binding antiterminator [Serratia proteamaculans]CAI1678261.1 Rho-binding antiterminator [Serratia proteamaculans]CAI2485386.1 Rho-binding antiterminator [Serratia proteamaculans]
MNRYQPINCDLHDFLEIACLYGYRLDVELVNGQRFQATALTIQTLANEGEFIYFDNQQVCRLDHLSAITPKERDALFGRIALTE